MLKAIDQLQSQTLLGRFKQLIDINSGTLIIAKDKKLKNKWSRKKQTPIIRKSKKSKA